MRDAIHALKYEGLHSAARPLGTMLAKALSQLAATAPAEMLVVPVPLHRSKRAQRGFNQSRLLASCALAALRRTHPAWLLKLAPTTILRLRPTASQASLTPRQRRSNVRGAFRVAHPEAVQSKHILVIDDIFTTGATVRSVAQELRRAGAASVWIGTLARARLYFGKGRVVNAVYVGRAKNQGESSGLPASQQADQTLSASMYSSSKQPSF
jgi:ComF family protein